MNAGKPDLVLHVEQNVNAFSKKQSAVSLIANRLFQTQSKAVHKSVSVDFSKWRAIVSERRKRNADDLKVQQKEKVDVKPIVVSLEIATDSVEVKKFHEDRKRATLSDILKRKPMDAGGQDLRGSTYQYDHRDCDSSLEQKCTCQHPPVQFTPARSTYSPSRHYHGEDDCCCSEAPDVVWSSRKNSNSHQYYEDGAEVCEEQFEYLTEAEAGHEGSIVYEEVHVSDDEKVISSESQPEPVADTFDDNTNDETALVEERTVPSAGPLAFTIDFGSSGLEISDPVSRFVPRHKKQQTISSKESATPPRSITPQSGKVGSRDTARGSNLRSKTAAQDVGYLTSETEEDSNMTILSRASPMIKRREFDLSNQKTKASSSPPTRERLLNLKERSPSPPQQKFPVRKITPSPQATKRTPVRKDTPPVHNSEVKKSEEKKAPFRKILSKPKMDPPDISSSEVENETDGHADNCDKVSESGTYTIDADSPEVENSRKDIDRVFQVKGTDSSDCSPDCEDGLKTSRWVSDWAAKTALQHQGVNGKPPLDPRCGSMRDRNRTASRDGSPVKSSRQSSLSSSPLQSPRMGRSERVWSPDHDSFEEEKPRRRLPVLPTRGRSSDGDSPTGNKPTVVTRSTSVETRSNRRNVDRQLSNENRSRSSKPGYDSFIDDASFDRILAVEKKNHVNSAKYDVKTTRQTSYVIETKIENNDNDDARSVASTCSSSDVGYKSIIGNIIQKSENKPASRLDRLSKPPARMLMKNQQQHQQPPPQPALSSNFSRNDGGRYSLKVPQSAKQYSPLQAVAKTKPRPQSGEPRRSNSTLNNKETEFQMWKRRKSYDPLKAAREGNKKKTAVRSSTIMSQSMIQETTLENEEPPENLHRSSSLTCFEDPPPLVSKRTVIEEDSQSLWDYRDLSSSPRLPRKPLESPRLRRRPIADSFMSDTNVSPDRRSLILEDQSMRTKQLEVLDNLVIATIHNLSGKIKGQADGLLKKLRSQFLDDPARSQALDAVLYRLNEPETPPTTSSMRTTSRDLASTLKILKRLDQVFQVLDDTLFEEIDDDDTGGD